MIYGVIMAGGAGTRFWPPSRRGAPKQLLPLWDDRTLLELTVERLEPLVPLDRLLIVAGEHLAEPIRRTLPHLPADNLLIEPAARNTLPCIALAVAEVSRRDPDPVLGVFSADQHIDDADAFLDACRLGEQAARAGRIATLGIRPTRPETGFGYLRYPGTTDPVQPVEAFVEKPDRATAERYLAEGTYLWNAGIFFFTPETFQAELDRQRPSSGRQMKPLTAALEAGDRGSLAAAFGQLEATSVDYGIMEGARDVVVIPARFGWNDVGHWAALDQVLPKTDGSNVVLGDVMVVDTDDSVLINRGVSGKTMAVLGMRDVVVVETPDALLVLPKAQAQRVREVVAALRAAGRKDVL